MNEFIIINYYILFFNYWVSEILYAKEKIYSNPKHLTVCTVLSKIRFSCKDPELENLATKLCTMFGSIYVCKITSYW